MGLKRARFVHSELVAACESVADDGLTDAVDILRSMAKEWANADDTVASLPRSPTEYTDIAAALRGQMAHGQFSNQNPASASGQG